MNRYDWEEFIGGAKVTATILLLVLLCVLVFRLIGTVDRVDALVDHTDANLQKTFANLNYTLSTLQTTIGTANQAVAETRDLISKQKQYQDAQNKQILAVLEQGETALINAQRVMEDMNDSQKAATEATIQAVNDLKPVLENAAKAAEEAAKTISDPNIKRALENLANSLKNVDVATANVATTTGRIDKRVEQALKPGNLIWNGFKGLLGIGANTATIVK